MKTTICIAEDRTACEPALRLLLLSLNSHSPNRPVSLFYPTAGDEFLKWVEGFPQVRLQTERLKHGFGWNIKPQALLQLLDQGFEEIIWIDSDIIITGDVSEVFDTLDENCVAATEDALGEHRSDDHALRTRLWGLPVGRVLPFGLNSGVVRVTKQHRSLVRRWWELLQSPQYQEVQKRDWAKRPVHMLGDQDVLTALLASEEFAKIPLFILRRGKHIVQFNGVYGYTVVERIRNLFGDGPTFVHSFAGKPWLEQWKPASKMGATELLKTTYLDVSPYTLEAKNFETRMGADTNWMESHYGWSQTLRLLGLGRRELTGLPVAAVMDLVRVAKCVAKPFRPSRNHGSR